MCVYTQTHAHTHHSRHKLTVLASVKGLYSSKPPGGADRVTWVTEGSYRGKTSKQELKLQQP